MVRWSRVWRAVWRMGHPQVRWSVWLMTQHGGMPAQLQGEGEGVEALPLNWVECGFFCPRSPVVFRAHVRHHSQVVYLSPADKCHSLQRLVSKNLPILS